MFILKIKEDLFIAVLEKLFLDWEEFVLVNSDENAR
jgi:hypothetical protein